MYKRQVYHRLEIPTSLSRRLGGLAGDIYEVEMTFDPTARRSLVGIEPELMNDLHRIARQRQVSTQTLVNVWLQQRVDQMRATVAPAN